MIRKIDNGKICYDMSFKKKGDDDVLGAICLPITPVSGLYFNISVNKYGSVTLFSSVNNRITLAPFGKSTSIGEAEVSYRHLDNDFLEITIIEKL